jgi:hypothetical protein
LFLESIKKIDWTLLESEPAVEILNLPIDEIQPPNFKSAMNQNFNCGIDTVVYLDGVSV